MHPDVFARALFQGLGRTIHYAHTHDVGPFAELIRAACLYNPVYDAQVNSERADYLLELIAASGDAVAYHRAILAALRSPDEEMDEEQLFELALRLAQRGDAAARQAMVARFHENLSSGDTTGYEQMIALDGDAGLPAVIRTIGAAMGRAVRFDEASSLRHPATCS